MKSYLCPNCLSHNFIFVDSTYICGDCSKVYSTRNDIPVFCDKEASFIWGSYQNRIGNVIEQSSVIGWHDAFMDLLSEIDRKEAISVYNRTYGHVRLALSMLIPVSPKARVLDFGSGLGVISMGLSKYCHSVTAIDQLYDHVEWLQLACQAEQISNIEIICGGGSNYLPFPDDSFDIIILNGVLEWVASNSKGNPKKVQQAFLIELARVLKPSGALFIGIENRLNHRYFKGSKEGHIKMKYGALLPRFITHLYLQLTRGVPYREYTYSLFGYRKLLKNAGLKHCRFFAASPHYGYISSVLPLGIEKGLEPTRWNICTHHRAARKPFSYFSSAFVFTSAREFFPPCLIDKAISVITYKLKWRSPITLIDEIFRVTSTGKAVIKLEHNSKQYCLKIALNKVAGAGIQNHYDALSYLLGQSLHNGIRQKLKKPLLVGEVDGFTYILEDFHPGYNGREVVIEETGRNRLCEDAFKFITGLTDDTRIKVVIGEEIFSTYFSRPFLALRNWFTNKEWKEYDDWFKGIESRIKKRLINKNIVLVPRHGDFVPENCLVDENGHLHHVLDWELYEDRGLALYDWITFVGKSHRPRIKVEMKAMGNDPDRTKYHGYPDIFLEGGLRQQLINYLERINMDRVFLEPLVFMWWVMQLRDWERYCLYHPDWRGLRVFPLIERLKVLAEILG